MWWMPYKAERDIRMQCSLTQTKEIRREGSTEVFQTAVYMMKVWQGCLGLLKPKSPKFPCHTQSLVGSSSWETWSLHKFGDEFQNTEAEALDQLCSLEYKKSVRYILMAIMGYIMVVLSGDSLKGSFRACYLGAQTSVFQSEGTCFRTWAHSIFSMGECICWLSV